jgi:hypothetical protein
MLETMEGVGKEKVGDLSGRCIVGVFFTEAPRRGLQVSSSGWLVRGSVSNPIGSLVVRQAGWLDSLGTRLPTPQGGRGFGLSSSCLDEFAEGMRPSVVFDRLQLPAIHTLSLYLGYLHLRGWRGLMGMGFLIYS